VEVEDLKRVYMLFIDQKRSLKYLEDYQKQFAAAAAASDAMES